MKNTERRRFSGGTLLMLAATVLVLAGTFFVLARLSSGKPVDLTRLRPGALALQTAETAPAETPQAQRAEEAAPTAAPAVQPVQASDVPAEKSFTLTVGGTVALAGEVRSNSYYSDVKQFDYYDIMTLLKKELRSDINIVFLENILSTDEKASDTVAAGAALSMLKAAGIDAAACGFARAFDKGEAGVLSTRKLLSEYGIQALGVYENGSDSVRITEANGVKAAILQYTNSMQQSVRKNMARNGQADMVPAADAEQIAADIANAKRQGCDAVIVLVQWGSTGKAPDRNMKALAQQIADAGADLIIGNGSRIVSGAETLTASGTGRKVLCVWSLGTVLSGDRSNIRRMAGMLLHVTVCAENGQAAIREACYTPLYTWKYKMDGRFYYRCLPANGYVPDGMASDQQKQMQKAAETVRNAMKDAPLEEREVE